LSGDTYCTRPISIEIPEANRQIWKNKNQNFNLPKKVPSGVYLEEYDMNTSIEKVAIS
jgi:hypothetical protein